MADRFAVGPLVEGIEAGSRPAIARAITLVESGRPAHRERARELLAAIAPRTGGAVRLGISGIPGAGKSTFIDALGMRLVEAGHRVAVLAVDPSSSRTGGSILGDRTRMAQLSVRDEAFVRPSPSGGHLGGVARATRESMLVLEAAGFDTIVVETVGVGQSEVAVAGMVDTFLLLLIARSGDQLQGIKRGIVEIADLIAINKADGDHEREAKKAARELDGALRLMNSGGRRRPLVLTCSALTGAGLDEVWEKVTAHRDALVEAGELDARRAAQQLEWMWAMTDATLAEAVRRAPTTARVREEVEADVAAGRITAVDGSARLLAALAEDVPGLGWDGAERE